MWYIFLGRIVIDGLIIIWISIVTENKLSIVTEVKHSFMTNAVII